MSATTFQHRHHPENGAWRKPHSRARARTTEHAVKASALVGESSHRAPQIGFTGRYLDKETGLWYFRNRYYSGTLGRFIGRDPARYVNGYNLYRGVFSPNYVDPFGLWSCATVVTWSHIHYINRMKKGMKQRGGLYGGCNRWYPEGCYATDPARGVYLPAGQEAEYGSEPNPQEDLNTGLLERPPGDMGLTLPGPHDPITLPGNTPHPELGLPGGKEAQEAAKKQILELLTNSENYVKKRASEGDCCKCKEYCLYFIFMEEVRLKDTGVTRNARDILRDVPGWARADNFAEMGGDQVLIDHDDSYKESMINPPQKDSSLSFFYYKKCFPCAKKGY
jgi:RHS repeat-associated protein